MNVSPHQLMSSDFCAVVAGVLTRTDMDPAALMLEVTENIFIEDGDRAITVLSELKDLGVKLAMDDFGTGYSSLSYLRRLPIEIVKIDQSFVADMNHGSMGWAIVDAVTSLAHVLELTVSAEGVETQSQHDEVSRIGCDSAQGYYYGRPMPASAIIALLGALPKSGQLYLPAPGGLAAELKSMSRRAH